MFTVKTCSIQAIATSVVIICTSANRIARGDDSKVRVRTNFAVGEIEVSIRDGRVQNNQSLRDRRVHLVQEEQTTLRKSFIKLGFLIIAVGIDEASQLVLLRNGVGEVKIQTQSFRDLLANDVLTGARFASQINGDIQIDNIENFVKLLMRSAVGVRTS